MGVPREVRRGDVTRPAPGVSFPKLPEVGGKMLRRRRKNRGRYARDTRRFGQLGGFPREWLDSRSRGEVGGNALAGRRRASSSWREDRGDSEETAGGRFDETVVRGVIFPREGEKEGKEGELFLVCFCDGVGFPREGECV